MSAPPGVRSKAMILANPNVRVIGPPQCWAWGWTLGNVSVQAADGGECPQTALCVVICTGKVGADNARFQ